MMSPSHDGHGHGGQAHPATELSRLILKDPVCGMDVTPGEAAGGSAEHAGQTFWFCSPGCREKFVADPVRYTAQPALRHGTAPPPRVSASRDDRIYTCPMHPEVRQKGPGACPKCGMALEPLEVIAEEGPNPELIDMSRRFWVSLALTVPVFAIATAEMVTPVLVASLGATTRLWI